MRIRDRAARWLAALLCFASLMCLSAEANAQPTFIVGGGLTPPNGDFQPDLFPWLSQMVIFGTGFEPTVPYAIVLHGPLNSSGVVPTDRVLQTLFADRFGNLDGTLTIPYRDGAIVNGTLPITPQPGRYEVRAVVDPSNPVIATNQINLIPQTVPTFIFSQFIGWASSRGGRDGWLDDNSPERADPEWMPVWNQHPVGLYATVAETDLAGGNQPAFISHTEFPGTHYAHDVNLELLPDPEYKWVLGTANFNSQLGEKNYGRIELEWEMQNDGTPYTYGHGNIGMPLWAMPSAGDRVYTVGRWALDNGHPASGDRTEIHPARLLATIRKRDTAVQFFGATCLTRAQQVDIFVSGHGGGSNQWYGGLEDLLDNDGEGGGRLDEFMPDLPGNSLIHDTYFSYGPSDSTTVDAITALLGISGGATATYESVAGPSGIATNTSTGLPAIWDHSMPVPTGLSPWTLGPEQRPVNDMNYDFDVPLPAAPPGATSVQVSVNTHPGHTTGVREAITYTNPNPLTGLPTTAHIHLPYLGADDGVYARTLKFYWDAFSPPGRHFSVKMNSFDTLYPVPYQLISPGRWNIWTEVSGQWTFLTGLNLAGFTAPQLGYGKIIGGLDAATFDVFLDDADTFRVFTQGYEAHDFDSLFGGDVGKPAYDVGVDLLEAQYLGNGDNVDLGGALFQSFTNTTIDFEGVQGTHNVHASPVDYTFKVVGNNGVVDIGAHTSLFGMRFTTTYVPRPARMQVADVPVDFSGVCLGTSADRPVRIYNFGEENLDVSNLAVTGSGFSRPPSPSLPFSIAGGGYVDFTVRFSPTDVGPHLGALTITDSDPCQPPLSIDLNATPIFAVARLSGSLQFGILPVGDHGQGSTQVLNFSIDNTASCPLIIDSIALTAGDVADFQILPFISTHPISIAPGGSLSVPVQFNPTKGGTRSATISVTPGDDPTHSSPLTITATGGAPSRSHRH